MLLCKACLWILVVSCLLSSGRMLVHSPRTGEDAAENARRSGHGSPPCEKLYRNAA